MRHPVVHRATALTVLAALCIPACSTSSHRQVRKDQTGKPAARTSAPYLGNRGYALPDSPFTHKGTVVTATCEMGARSGAVSVRAWDPRTWQMRAEREFALPDDAAFTNYTGAKAVSSPLVDLCGTNADNRSPYGVSSLEDMAPRIRALFDLTFTHMAVVFRDPGDDAISHAGYVTSEDGPDGVVRLSGAAGDDEQNAVMSPDGRSAWFTYTAPGGEQRIGSRSVEGDRHLTDQGPAAGHGLPLTVLGKPPRALQANMVHLAPKGRRITANAPKVFGTVFDTSDTTGPLTRTSAHGATLLSGCVGVVGWSGDDQVLCRTPSGSFLAMDSRTGRPTGPRIAAVGPDEGMVGEGMLTSPDGKEFIVSVHRPNARDTDEDYSYEEPDFRVVPIAPGGLVTKIAADLLDSDTVFLNWS
ncbi:hypothetical protein [Streptomyces sp. NPDC049040]|uniref:hypothetical protein n=1 Tax=Streptomyces sp. NPDC049040 TaxID=3365593 RepID=UPI003712F6DC